MTEEVALYRLYDVGGRLLYIGVAKDVGHRFAGHRADKGWWSDVSARKTGLSRETIYAVNRG